MIFVIVATLVLLYLFMHYKVSRGKPKLPPGLKEIPLIKGLPIIGILHKTNPTMHHYLSELSKVHGPIFEINFGMRHMIVLNDFDSIKKAFKDQGDNFSGRLRTEGFSYMSLDSGLLFQEGHKWAQQRSFVLKVLRDFGLGKSKSVEIVENECGLLLNELEEYGGKCVNFDNLIPVYTANIISKFIMNKRFTRKDPKLHLIEKIMHQVGRKKDPIEIMHFLFPILDRYVFLMKLFGLKLYDEVHQMFRDEIKEHSDALDFDSEGDDLMDRFLIEQHHLKEKNGSVDTFTDSQLIRNSFELFIAGYETTSTTLGWGMLFMAKFPVIQNKVFQEIIDQVGEERLPTMNDKKSLNYTQAVLDEILRISTVVPFAIFHRTFNDCNLNGYFIPKDTLIVPNLFACHMDPEVWKNPNQFYPEHFLTNENNAGLKYSPREELISFGIGKRQCLGESLARMELFLFFTSILQRFEVRFAEELTEKKYEEALIGENGFIRFSSVKNYIFRKR